EFGRAVLDEHVELLERALVEQKLDALAGGQFAPGMLRLDALFAAAKLGARAPFLEGVQDVLHRPSARPFSETIFAVLEAGSDCIRTRLQPFVLTRFLDANRYPLRLKTLYTAVPQTKSCFPSPFGATRAPNQDRFGRRPMSEVQEQETGV